MKPSDDLRIVAKYTGQTGNLQPLANAFANALKSAMNENGQFADPALEAEFQEWIKQERRDDLAGRMEKRESRTA